MYFKVLLVQKINMNYEGVIIEESLEDKSVLSEVKIVKTKTEVVSEKHKTPWVNQWTKHTVRISGEKAKIIAEKISKSLDSKHHWYADYKNDKFHYIIFRNKIFFVHRNNKKEYEEATRYGIFLGIPYYQVDFSPFVKAWKR